MQKNKRLDIVYILSNESPWNDKEIMYSVRSVEQNIKGYGNIFIIGRKPLFFNDKIIEIPFEDTWLNKARNIKCKIRRAAADHRISRDFMLLNDDYFIIKPIEAPDQYPYYYKCDFAESVRRNRYNLDYLPHVLATQKVLRENRMPLKNFDTHFPIIYNKSRVCEVCDKYDWNVQDGFIFKSIYCNTLGIEGVQRNDCKVNHPYLSSQWPVINTGFECFSIGDRAVNKNLEQYLFNLFPKKSSYERTEWPNTRSNVI